MTELIRVPNWDTALVEFALEVDGEPFEWGRTDCVSIVRLALSRMYGGTDPLDGHIGSWTTKRGALRVSKNTDALDALKRAGFVEVAPVYATTGDVALGATADACGAPAVSIVLPMRMMLVSTPEHGVRMVHRDDINPGTRYWRHE